MDAERAAPELVALDVSGLEPPEPLERILEQLRTLQPHRVLRVRHRREPLPLYPILDQGGYRHCCYPIGEAFLIYIWHRAGPVTAAFCRADAEENRP